MRPDGDVPRLIRRRDWNFLLNEIEAWRECGLISGEQAGDILGLYDLRRGRLQRVLSGVGGVLVGLGFLSFIAANWLSMSRLLRAGLILVGYIAAMAAAWRCEDKFPRTSRAFLLLAGFIYGGGIFLMGQMFHQGGTWHSATGWWILGLFPAALLFGDLWQTFLIQSLSALYLLWGELSGLGLPPGGGETALRLLFLRSEGFLLLAGLWALWARVGGRFVFNVNAVMTLLYLGLRLARIFNDSTALLAMAVLGFFLSLPSPRCGDDFLLEDVGRLGLLTMGCCGLPLTWSEMWRNVAWGLSSSELAVGTAVVLGIVLLWQLHRRRASAGLFLALLVGRYFFDGLLGFMSKAWGFTAVGAALLLLGFLLERRRRGDGGGDGK